MICDGLFVLQDLDTKEEKLYRDGPNPPSTGKLGRTMQSCRSTYIDFPCSATKTTFEKKKTTTLILGAHMSSKHWWIKSTQLSPWLYLCDSTLAVTDKTAFHLGLKFRNKFTLGKTCPVQRLKSELELNSESIKLPITESWTGKINLRMLWRDKSWR